MHCVANALGVADVADEEAHLGGELRRLLLQAVTHVVLFLLITGEDSDLSQVGVHEVLKHGVAERASAARDHQGLVFKGGRIVHLFAFLTFGFCNLVKKIFRISYEVSSEKPLRLLNKSV